MCGRYTIRRPREDFAGHFGLDFPETGRFNVAPSQDVPVIRDDVTLMRWGLVPSWAKEPKAAFAYINAHRETVATSNAFRSAFKHRRCLMPADGFFEWSPGPPKVPHYFQLAGGEPFAFAGLWERWGESLETCALITTMANSVVGPVHDRMPAILHPSDYAMWLAPRTSVEDLHAMLGPYDEPMTGTPVGPFVNNPRNQGPRCIEPA